MSNSRQKANVAVPKNSFSFSFIPYSDVRKRESHTVLFQIRFVAVSNYRANITYQF